MLESILGSADAGMDRGRDQTHALLTCLGGNDQKRFRSQATKIGSPSRTDSDDPIKESGSLMFDAHKTVETIVPRNWGKHTKTAKREAVMLVLCEGASIRAVARKFGASKYSVLCWVSTVRQQLKKDLSPT
jgi:hypothetical protein